MPRQNKAGRAENRQPRRRYHLHMTGYLPGRILILPRAMDWFLPILEQVGAEAL